MVSGIENYGVLPHNKNMKSVSGQSKTLQIYAPEHGKEHIGNWGLY